MSRRRRQLWPLVDSLAGAASCLPRCCGWRAFRQFGRRAIGQPGRSNSSRSSASRACCKETESQPALSAEPTQLAVGSRQPASRGKRKSACVGVCYARTKYYEFIVALVAPSWPPCATSSCQASESVGRQLAPADWLESREQYRRRRRWRLSVRMRRARGRRQRNKRASERAS